MYPVVFFFKPRLLASIVCSIAPRIPPEQIEDVVFYGYVFLQSVLSKVLICHLPVQKLKTSGGLWGRGEAVPGADCSG